MALYYFRYSTWKGKRLYLEDFVIKEEFRGKGIGTKVFNKLFELSIEYECNGMSWQIISSNRSALNFYEKFNSNLDDGWINGSLSKKEILNYLNS